MPVVVKVKIDVGGIPKRLRKLGVSITERELLEGIGARHLKWIGDNFKQGGLEKKWAPLAAATKFKKDSAAMLQDRGKLRQSFVVKVDKGQRAVEVGTNDPRAVALHEGAGPRDIVRRQAKALAFPHPSGDIILTTGRFRGKRGFIRQRVRNHVLPGRPLIPSQATGEKLALNIVSALINQAVKAFEGGRA